MRQLFKSDLKDHILNKRFIWSVIILTILQFVVSYPYYQQTKQMGSSEAGMAWMNLAHFAYTNDNFLIGVSIIAPLAGGAFLENELKSRFILFSIHRGKKIQYFISKYACSLIAGALCIGIAVLLNLGGSFWLLRDIDETAMSSVYVQKVILDVVRLALFGGMWSVIGTIGAVVIKNSNMTSIITFVLYYVTTIFQERYYRELPVLSTKQWVVPGSFNEVMCLIIEMVAMILLWGCFYIVLRKRVAHV